MGSEPKKTKKERVGGTRAVRHPAESPSGHFLVPPSVKAYHASAIKTHQASSCTPIRELPPDAQELIRVGPDRANHSHHFNSAVHEFATAEIIKIDAVGVG